MDLEEAYIIFGMSVVGTRTTANAWPTESILLDLNLGRELGSQPYLGSLCAGDRSLPISICNVGDVDKLRLRRDRLRSQEDISDYKSPLHRLLECRVSTFCDGKSLPRHLPSANPLG